MIYRRICRDPCASNPQKGNAGKKLVETAAKAGVRVYGMSDFVIGEGKNRFPSTVILGYASLKEKRSSKDADGWCRRGYDTESDKNMKLTENWKNWKKATKQWVAVAAAFILVFPRQEPLGQEIFTSGNRAAGQENQRTTDITQAGKNTGDSLSEDQQKTTGTEETIEEQSIPSDQIRSNVPGPETAVRRSSKVHGNKRHDPDSQAVR